MHVALRLVVLLAITAGHIGGAWADKACEQFLDSSVKTALTHSKESTPSELSSRLEDFVVKKVDTARIATFTLGKYAKSQSNADLERLNLALQSYFVDMLQTSIATSDEIQAEILGSHDRRKADCIVETVFHLGESGDNFLLWRVFHEEESYRIYDVAIRDHGQTLWLSLELRAQFAALLQQKDGSIDLIISNLAARTSGY